MAFTSKQTRRQFLGYMAAGVGSGTLLSKLSMADQTGDSIDFEDLDYRHQPPTGHGDVLELTSVEAIAAMKRGDLKAESYAQTLLDQAERLGFLNAFVSLDRERILEAARMADQKRQQNVPLGRLHGLPLTLKDIINTDFAPTTAATPGLTGNVPKAGNAEIVNILLAAGAIPFGKANMHELSFGPTSINPFTGTVANPYNPEMISGGSSGGPAASVAARITPAGIGADTAGSVRIPASLCGVCGLRPTTGSWPGDSRTIVPISQTRDTLGPMARSCDDLELFHRLVTNGHKVRPSKLRGLRLGIVPASWNNLAPGVAEVALNALVNLRDRGVQLVEMDIPGMSDLTAASSFPIFQYESTRTLTAYLDANTSKSDGTPVSIMELIDQVASPDVAASYKSVMPEFGGVAVPENVYLAALDARTELRKVIYRHFRAHRLNALIHPATVVQATPIENPSDIITLIRNTDTGSVAGMPGVSLPIGLYNGLPVSLGLDSLPGNDRELLSISMGLEKLFGRLQAPSLAYGNTTDQEKL